MRGARSAIGIATVAVLASGLTACGGAGGDSGGGASPAATSSGSAVTSGAVPSNGVPSSTVAAGKATTGDPRTVLAKMPFLMWRRTFYSQPAMAMDPVNQLALATTGRLSTVGTETLDGAEITRYRSVTDVAAVLGATPGLTEQHRCHVETTLKKSGKTFTLDFWINTAQELRRFREFGANDREEQAVTVTYSALGSAPAMTAPTDGDLRTSPDLDRFLDPSRAITGPGKEATWGLSRRPGLHPAQRRCSRTGPDVVPYPSAVS